MMKITGLSHLFMWENMHNWWLTKYFFAPLYIYTHTHTVFHSIQYFTEVSTPLTFLLIFYYIFSCDNTEEMALCYNVN